jgi:hypothetical protein
MTRYTRPSIVTAVFAAAVLIARPALAGPPLLRHPFDIGSARSLPMGTAGWQAVDRTYDVCRLVDATLGLLGASTPATVRMETIRRATIYAAAHPKQASALLNRDAGARAERAAVVRGARRLRLRVSRGDLQGGDVHVQGAAARDRSHRRVFSSC